MPVEAIAAIRPTRTMKTMEDELERLAPVFGTSIGSGL